MNDELAQNSPEDGVNVRTWLERQFRRYPLLADLDRQFPLTLIAGEGVLTASNLAFLSCGLANSQGTIKMADSRSPESVLRSLMFLPAEPAGEYVVPVFVSLGGKVNDHWWVDFGINIKAEGQEELVSFSVVSLKERRKNNQAPRAAQLWLSQTPEGEISGRACWFGSPTNPFEVEPEEDKIAVRYGSFSFFIDRRYLPCASLQPRTLAPGILSFYNQ